MAAARAPAPARLQCHFAKFGLDLMAAYALTYENNNNNGEQDDNGCGDDDGGSRVPSFWGSPPIVLALQLKQLLAS